MSENRTRFRLDQRRAPIYEALEQFRQMRVVPFDVPGHKRGRGNPELTAFLGQQCVGVDVNSMKPLDNLCHPVSVIREAEELAADAFGAAHAFLMVGGTTSSVQSMVLTACKRSRLAPAARALYNRAGDHHTNGGTFMADYQEYRRRILHRRWRRMFTAVALLVLLVLLISVGVLWKRLHRDQRPNTVEGPTILQQELTGTEWNTISYTPARRLSVQTQADGTTAMDFRLAAQPASEAVDRSWFSDVWFLGDSLTQGMQMYENGLPNAHFCAYKGVGPNAVVNGATCKRADGVAEIPMDVLAAQQPRALYILLGTNVLNRDDDYSSFLTYYRLMLDMISQSLPNTTLYVQSITPVRPEVREKHPGLYKERLCQINDELAAIALEKNCVFLNLWEVLADENGDLKAEYAQPDGYHVKPDGYSVWVEYLAAHT